MNFDMLEAILRMRTHLHFRNICCQKFVPSQRMFSKFTSEIYDTKKKEAGGTSTSTASVSGPGSDDCLAETMTLFAQKDDDEDSI